MNLKILHPNNNKYFKLAKLKTYYKDGYYKIIKDEESKRLDYFLMCFEDYRTKNKKRIIDTSLYENLPFSINDSSWKAKQKDIKIIDKLIGNKTNLKILDVGCWNGWLCNYLSKKGHNLVGVDLFKDELDGLGAKKYYKTDFLLLQMKPNELFRIEEKFDLIIFNRIWPYFNNHQIVFNDVKKNLSKNGQILFFSLPFYKNPKTIKNNLNVLISKFKKKYGISLLFIKSKGYLTYNDKVFFYKNRINLFNYNYLKNNFPLFSKKNKLFYGIYND